MRIHKAGMILGTLLAVIGFTTAVFAADEGRVSADDNYSMFGKNLEKADFTPGDWEVNENGELVSPGTGEIWTKQPYGSFVCSFEFKTSEKANAGFLLHCNKKSNWIPNTIEIQLYDSYNRKPDIHSCGSFYGYQAPTASPVKAPGEWNSMTVIAFGTKVTVLLNDEKINEIDTAEWTDAKKSPAGTDIEEKFQGKTLASQAPFGFIGLQGKHSDSLMAYRNLTLTPLFGNPLPKESAKSLFGDKLENAEFDPAVWSIDADGVLHATKDEPIWTKEKFDNYTLDFEFQTTKDANSGVIVQCSDKEKWIPNSFEVQIFDSFEKGNDMTQCGAIYGRCAPFLNLCKAPGQWNRMTVMVQGKKILVVLNGELITEFDKEKWTDAATNPDGSDVFSWLVNKAPCDTDDSGFIGFQGLHAGAPVIYRNIRIAPATPLEK